MKKKYYFILLITIGTTTKSCWLLGGCCDFGPSEFRYKHSVFTFPANSHIYLLLTCLFFKFVIDLSWF